MAGTQKHIMPTDPVMGLLVEASLTARCFDAAGETVQPYEQVRARLAKLKAAVEAAPDHPGGEWDRDVWGALRAAARLAADAPYEWRGLTSRVLGAAVEAALRLNADARQRALEGIPDDELPYHLRH